MCQPAPVDRPALRLLQGAALAMALLAVPLARADAYDDALKLSRSGQHEQVLTVLDAALAQNTSDPRLRFLKGLTLRQLQRTDDALAVFTTLTQDYPELPEPYNNLAVLHAARGQYDKARTALEMAIKLNPNYALAHENLGDVYAMLAAQSYARALRLDSYNPALASKQSALGKVLPSGPLTQDASAAPQ